MDIMKVFIENWSKAKPLLLEWAPIIVAVIAVIFSGYSMYLSRKAFIASHRPYVWAVTHAFLDNNRRIVVDIDTLRKLCLNAPAEITRQEYSYIAIREDDSEDIIHTEAVSEGKFIMYPADPKVSQETHKMDFSLEPEITNQRTKELLRKVRIDYKEVSSARKYFFEGEWEYDRQGNTWKPIKSIGN